MGRVSDPGGSGSAGVQAGARIPSPTCGLLGVKLCGCIVDASDSCEDAGAGVASAFL